MSNPESFKSCCANFYADDLVRRLLGDSFHPGGEKLTRQLLVNAGVTATDRLLDVATGQGTSAILAAGESGCDVTAVDLSAENLSRAAARAEEAGVGERVHTERSDAEHLPFADNSFDVVLCECAFCTFVDKPTAAREMTRVLEPGGRLVLSDMVIRSGDLPPELDALMARVACIADAVDEPHLAAAFEQAGLEAVVIEDASWGLTQMVEEIRERLLALDLAQRLGKLDLGGFDLSEGKRLAKRSLEVIREGKIGYATLVARRPARP